MTYHIAIIPITERAKSNAAESVLLGLSPSIQRRGCDLARTSASESEKFIKYVNLTLRVNINLLNINFLSIWQNILITCLRMFVLRKCVTFFGHFGI